MRAVGRMCAGLTICALLTLFCPQVLAQQVKPEVIERVGKAKQLFDQKRYEEAIVELKEAYKIQPNPVLLRNIARCYQNMAGQEEQALQTFERYLESSPDPEEVKEIQGYVAELRRKLSVLKSEITIASEPTKAFVYIDQKTADHLFATPFKKWLDFGPHIVYVSKEGYQDLQKNILVEKDKHVSLSLTLKRKSTKGMFSVTTTPDSCAVLVDGVLVGKTPLRNYETNPGTYVLEVQKDGYTSWKGKLLVRADEPQNISLALAPKVVATAPAVTTEAPRRRHLVWKWLTIGLGAAIMTGGAVVHVVAFKLAKDARDLEPRDFGSEETYRDEYDSKAETAKVAQGGAFLMYGVGGAAVIGGILWLVLDKPKPPHKSTLFQPTIGRDRVMVNATFRF